MHPVTQESLIAYFVRSRITADCRITDHRVLSFAGGARRIISVTLGESDYPEYLCRAISCLLELDDVWLVIPRVLQGSCFDIPLGSVGATALSFDRHERSTLSTLLIDYSKTLYGVHGDLWLASGEGNLIISWDHHMISEELDIFANDVEVADRVLVRLNHLGAELSLFYRPGSE